MKKNKQIAKQNTFAEFLLYTTPGGKVKVEIFLRDENLWLTQAKIAELFGVERSVGTNIASVLLERIPAAYGRRDVSTENRRKTQKSRQGSIAAKNATTVSTEKHKRTTA